MPRRAAAYSGARHFDTRDGQLSTASGEAHGTRLDEVNTALIHVVREMLGIDTEEVRFTDGTLPRPGASIV